ncbi:AI-2E family transporter [Aneurinibacillus danicus]|uniref:AI-2E family transporter n=1 Tax=Aneurinibacillus danicus TaxID=267746 RepID=A0A511VAY2_9BACL|nr:AI-2E family transporter [Aneurinibacillus danicus]GEN35481.1 AI-2E family transporter [Aneurinibacillus danicus]
MEKITRTNWLYFLAVLLMVLLIVFLLGKVSVFFVGFIEIVKKVLTPFFFALIFAYLLNPVVKFLTDRHFPRGLAVFLIYTLFFLFLIFLVMNAGPILVREYKELSAKFPELAGTYRDWIGRMRIQQARTPFSLHGGLTTSIQQMELAMTNYVNGLFTGMDGWVEKILLVLLIPFIVFYMLKDMKPMQKGALLLVPGKHRPTVRRMLHDIDTALGHYVRGQLIVCGIVGALAYAGYFFIGLPYAIVFAFFVAITNIIPYIGPVFGAAPAILFALTVSWKMALYALIINAIIQVIEGNIVSPLIVGKSLHMHPLLIILSVMIGGEIAGIAGLILAVPIVASLKVVVQHIIIHIVRKPEWQSEE